MKRLKRTKPLLSESCRIKATEYQWGLIDIAIKAFISEYPTQWFQFQQQLKYEASEWQLATKEHKELRKKNFRNTASFPVVYFPGGEDALLPVLDNIIPGLTQTKSVNYGEFLKRYPFFCPALKVNNSNF